MKERRKWLPLLVRWVVGGYKVNAMEFVLLHCRPGQSQVPAMDRIERPAK